MLLAIIYANFNLKKVEESKTSEFAVSLVSFSGSQNSNQIQQSNHDEQTNKNDKTIKKELRKQPKSPVKSKENIVKEQPKELAKSTPIKSITKPLEEKSPELAPLEKIEEKQEETRDKNDDLINKKLDEDTNETAKKEKDLGAKEDSPKEQESSKDDSSSDGGISSLSNNLDSMDLSAREKFNIQSQLNRCYRRAIDETKLNSKTKIAIKVEISEDGYIDSDLESSIDELSYNNPRDTGYKIAIDNIRRAIDLCSPLRNLPLDKYDAWREVLLEFDENDVK